MAIYALKIENIANIFSVCIVTAWSKPNNHVLYYILKIAMLILLL